MSSPLKIATVDSKELFNRYSMNCLAILESHDEVNYVDFPLTEGVKGGHIFSLWETRNAPFKLPNDLKKFYSLFNGLNISWNVLIDNGKVLNIGKIFLNKFENIKMISYDRSDICARPSFIPCTWLGVDINLDSMNCTMFALDSICDVGLVVLLYQENPHDSDPHEESERLFPTGYDCPTVWLVDNAFQCHFICASFSDYKRLMFSHFGIVGWQEAFTSKSLSIDTRLWMNLFCKERLCVDLSFINNGK